MSVSEPLILVVTDDIAGQRIDKAIALLATQQQSGISRARIQALMEAGHLRRDTKIINDASAKVRVGEIYSLQLPAPEKAEPEAQVMDLDIIYEDDDVIVIDKAVGMVVHPAPGNRDQTLVNALLAHCGATLSGIGGVARPGIVHRLDKDTSGLMVVAKNDTAHHALAAQFADRSLSRTYQALVWGDVVLPSGSIEAPIGRSTKDRKKMAVTAKGKAALTYYKVIENFGGVTLVECKLATGRTHQIRVHMAHLKHPLVGDKTYGSGRSKTRYEFLQKFPRQALHAVALQFIHPRTGKVRKFSSALPADMKELLGELESFHA